MGAGVTKIPSTYDALFQEAGAKYGIDWLLLKAQGWQESRLHPTAIALLPPDKWLPKYGETYPFRARGLMQILPTTAEDYGIQADNLWKPEINIITACRILDRYRHIFKSTTDEMELMKFTLAAYNGGPAYILMARKLAARAGKNWKVWEQVKPYLKEVVWDNPNTAKTESLRPDRKQITNYVDEIMNTYKELRDEVENADRGGAD